jgi:ubiquinone/menaquinone biosynthesis C-methylase UbiE
MESLPFSDSEFDCVLSAGSLSYGDNHRVLAGIWRVLKPGGVFICVDSLNHNPIYKINRWIHFLMGSRSRSTLARIPNFELIGHFRKKFCSVDVRYFGSASWLMPVVGRLIGIQYAAEASKFIDNAVRVRRSAFKFVMVARKGR